MSPFKYDGTFPLTVLTSGETVYSTGDGSGACIVISGARAVRVDVGDWVYRDSVGLVYAMPYAPGEVSA